jgi:endo-alpha-1,4-polygalactosaminidase (GH114 family)
MNPGYNPKMQNRKWFPAILIFTFGCSLLGMPVSATPTPAPSATVPSATGAPSTAEPSAGWKPAPRDTWQWQLSGEEVDTSVSADVYDLDLFDTAAEVVAALHGAGRRAVCYLSAGSREDWRPDAADFPKETIGEEYEGWPGENWLDIRALELLGPVLKARLDLCRAKGFDGVEPDNVDGYQNETGFPLTAEDQLRFNRWLAGEARARGLAVALKNDGDQAAELQPDFDFALLEDCFAEGWCELFRPFLAAGKAVWDAEYTDTGIDPAQFCPQAKALGIQAIWKNRELDAWRGTCPAD